ncbi:MAG: protein-glutamate O-methyltransferase CheR [Spirochaetales bacterium]|nr:protein-glutamate O-methyltransferase CheR [Leptospiraceae bacterium]MCP5481025.1 protein-glutamate O-methyltransferase CheR [Spirochaetales bacterium]MCP5485405.1 protein-glutamate O-methyltransferase CheR [Spirochaetales bacterium]
MGDIGDLNPAQFERFARVIHEATGIHLKPQKITLLSNRLRKRMRALGLSDFDRYYERVEQDQEGERGAFIAVVTTNETYFWRTTANFELLRNDLLPGLLERFPGVTLRFWSAGCSTGEEPYNMAMELTEAMKTTGPFDFEIVASDISRSVLDFAETAVYHGRRIERVPPLMLRRYFRPVPEEPEKYRVREDIQRRVRFEQENLFESKARDFHVVFCRNVMIYFTRNDQARLLEVLWSALVRGGYLIVGHSESLHSYDTPFVARKFDRGIAYQRAPEAENA